MMDPEQGGVPSLKSRIAALNLEEVHAPAPGVRPAFSYEQAAAKKKKAPPPPPPAKRPPTQHRGQTINNPPIFNNTTSSTKERGNQPTGPSPEGPTVQPALPPRPPPRPAGQTPPLPPRKSSEQNITRRGSAGSTSTIASANSTKTTISATSNGGTLYHIRAPAFDSSKLPPLPPKKAPVEEKTSGTLKSMKSKSQLGPEKGLPPQLPSRPSLPQRNVSQPRESTTSQEQRPTHSSRRSALSFGLNKTTELPPLVPTSRPLPKADDQPGIPPPIPMASRPNLDAIMASKPKPGATAECLVCRDYSGPDQHAAQFPRQSLPSSDVAWLAGQLTAPFPSKTDKARAIFTWLHHNVEYDAHSFFNNCVTPSTPEGVIKSGLAVCEGYATLFAALALKSGLQAVVVSGHGKGYGHAPMKPGDPVPLRKADGHAWNAVQIDNGEWKLVDACWGAGHLGCQLRGEGYQKSFNPNMFTMNNDEFGKRHFPSDSRYFFRIDGRPTLSWEEYMLDDAGEQAMVYGAAKHEGLKESSFEPSARHIKVYDPQQSPSVRFQFAAVCAHWDNEKNGIGKPMVMVLNVAGRDGRKSDYIPFQTDGRVWWLDVDRVELGAPGQKISVYAVKKFDGRDGRGVSYSEYKAKKGRVAMGFDGIAMWELI